MVVTESPSQKQRRGATGEQIDARSPQKTDVPSVEAMRTRGGLRYSVMTEVARGSICFQAIRFYSPAKGSGDVALGWERRLHVGGQQVIRRDSDGCAGTAQ